MKNLGESEKLQIGFPEMKFHYYKQKCKVEEAYRFLVKENDEIVYFDFSDSLQFDDAYRKKVESFQLKEEWYLWESEFHSGESKIIEVQYSLPFGMLYKTNERFFTYLLSTGVDWKGTIGKAEIIVNLKGIEVDSLITKQPNNYNINNNQLTWTFFNFEPTTNDDIKINYNSNKVLYTGKQPIPPLVIVNEIEKINSFNKINPNDIAIIKVIKYPEESEKFTNQKNGIIKIYTKEFFLTRLNKLINAKSKKKIIFHDYNQLTENYQLFVDEESVDFVKIIGIKSKLVTEVKIININKQQVKILIESHNCLYALFNLHHLSLASEALLSLLKHKSKIIHR